MKNTIKEAIAAARINGKTISTAEAYDRQTAERAEAMNARKAAEADKARAEADKARAALIADYNSGKTDAAVIYGLARLIIAGKLKMLRAKQTAAAVKQSGETVTMTAAEAMPARAFNAADMASGDRRSTAAELVGGGYNKTLSQVSSDLGAAVAGFATLAEQDEKRHADKQDDAAILAALDKLNSTFSADILQETACELLTIQAEAVKAGGLSAVMIPASEDGKRPAVTYEKHMYRFVERYINRERRQLDLKRLFVTNEDGDDIVINDRIASITGRPAAVGDDMTASLEDVRKAEAAAAVYMAVLSPVQRRIVNYRLCGHVVFRKDSDGRKLAVPRIETATAEAIAEKMHVSRASVFRNMETARAACVPVAASRGYIVTGASISSAPAVVTVNDKTAPAVKGVNPAVYMSVSEAARALNMTTTYVRMIADGRRKHARLEISIKKETARQLTISTTRPAAEAMPAAAPAAVNMPALICLSAEYPAEADKTAAAIIIPAAADSARIAAAEAIVAAEAEAARKARAEAARKAARRFMRNAEARKAMKAYFKAEAARSRDSKPTECRICVDLKPQEIRDKIAAGTLSPAAAVFNIG